MNEIKKLKEAIKKANKSKEAFKKEKKRAERRLDTIGKEDLKSRRKYKHFKKREVTFKFI